MKQEKSIDAPIEKDSSFVWEKLFRFSEHGGYVITVKYVPTNWLTRLMHVLGMIRPKEMIVEYQDSPLNGIYAQIVKHTRNETSAIFRAAKGTGKVLITIPKDTVNNFDFTMLIERLPS